MDILDISGLVPVDGNCDDLAGQPLHALGCGYHSDLLTMDENEITARKPAARSIEAKWMDIELGSGYRLSQEASQRIERKLLMAWNEMIELDGRVVRIDLENDCAEIEINYSTSHPGFFQGMFSLRYVISRQEVKERLKRPCTLWNRQNMLESFMQIEEKMKRWVALA
ncbi:MAG: hypothetical protein WBM08_05495 [Prochlorococcaceae cyanobacterium]